MVNELNSGGTPSGGTHGRRLPLPTIFTIGGAQVLGRQERTSVLCSGG